ncbi:hypothetical protein LMG28614_01099 [Paraburkholderia ultramafica]|uniref:Sulfotransferase family protein n=1 Tax=Paraburkholderia ultramafica TaxID=1544867 RepID=A0A6S7B5A6_9BURK|nr:chondroitin 4-O-sulfotransferase [Paraburkholderia ultramafica]CAB3780834.1 hypothetical protein LMG28614_01099 [Paraburkholderia ultramafica]
MPFPIFFIHPPKSGGSTVISFFELNKGNDQFANFEWDRSGWESCRAKLLTTSIGGGHHPYGIHRILKRPVNYCTILRDPLARQISHYRYAANGKNGDVVRGTSVSITEALVQRGTLSLDEWVAESLGGKNLFVQMLSGHSVLNESSLDIAQTHLRQHIGTVGVCENMSDFLLGLCGMSGLKLPFYFETNRTRGSSKNKGHLSEAARQKFLEDNCLDYEIFRDANRMIERYADESGRIFSNALDLVRIIQAEINQLENPHVHSSIVFGFDEAFLSKVLSVIRRFDLAPIDEYLEFAQSRQPVLADLFEGFVDTIRDGVVSGWAVNLSRPDQRVPIEVRVDREVVASGWSGEPRPDVANAGYPSSHAGFSIPLPAGISDGFHVAISNSPESLHNAGIWRQGWHCA